MPNNELLDWARALGVNVLRVTFKWQGAAGGGGGGGIIHLISPANELNPAGQTFVFGGAGGAAGSVPTANPSTSGAGGGAMVGNGGVGRASNSAAAGFAGSGGEVANTVAADPSSLF